jgi:hypothetical protein
MVAVLPFWSLLVVRYEDGSEVVRFIQAADEKQFQDLFVEEVLAGKSFFLVADYTTIDKVRRRSLSEVSSAS